MHPLQQQQTNHIMYCKNFKGIVVSSICCTSSVPACPTRLYNGICYFLFAEESPSEYKEAWKLCNAMTKGGKLAVIDSEEKTNHILQNQVLSALT